MSLSKIIYNYPALYLLFLYVTRERISIVNFQGKFRRSVWRFNLRFYYPEHSRILIYSPKWLCERIWCHNDSPYYISGLWPKKGVFSWPMHLIVFFNFNRVSLEGVDKSSLQNDAKKLHRFINCFASLFGFFALICSILHRFVDFCIIFLIFASFCSLCSILYRFVAFCIVL